MSKRQVVEELHKPARKNFKRRRVIIKGFDDLWQADLVEMGAYSQLNKNYKFLLTVIDTCSKYAWAIPIKNKKGESVTQAMKSIFKESKRHPQNLHTDDGTEFFNKTFKNLMNEYNINHYSTFSSLKASIVERFNRTIKEKMWKEFSLNGNYKWIHIIQNLVTEYNNTKHRTIKMRPSDVNAKNVNKLMKTVYNHIKIVYPAKFKIGESVRVSKNKHVFSKGYWPNYTTEIFKIRKIQNTNPTTYLLEDYQGQPIQGGFYEQEIIKAKHKDVYLVEKVLKTKDNKVFIKWLGFPSSHNSWINKANLL
jgi:hypothetical protein